MILVAAVGFVVAVNIQAAGRPALGGVAITQTIGASFTALAMFITSVNVRTRVRRVRRALVEREQPTKEHVDE